MPNRQTSTPVFAREMVLPLSHSNVTLETKFGLPSGNEKVHSLPHVHKIVGLKNPSCTNTERHGAVQLGSPIICQEEFASLDFGPTTITTSGGVSFGHEEACNKNHEEAGPKDEINHKGKSGRLNQSLPKKSKKKSKKKKKGGRYGSQRGKGGQNKQGSTPTTVSQPKERRINYTGTGGHGRINPPIYNSGGDGSGSDDESREEHGFGRGHYTGIAEEEEKVDENEEMDASYVSSSCPLDLQVEQQPPWKLFGYRKEVTGDLLICAREVNRLIVHVSYKSNCIDCREKNCSWVQKLLQHFRQTNCGCKLCQIVDLALSFHAKDCSSSDCLVYNCSYWKYFVNASRMERFEGQVIHSTTTAFKEKSHVSENIDYIFLQKLHVGKGTFGHVWRVWFYSITKQCEADLVVKEARYNLQNEASIHNAIRQNHPNLLGAMAIIQLNSPRKVMMNGVKDIYGYLLMERGERTLYQWKMEYRKIGLGIPFRDAFFYLFQVISGLCYLHQLMIVHKDVKDLNVLMFNGGQLVKLGDWDAAIFIRNEFEQNQTSVIPRKGTPGFCAKEVYNQQPHGFPADIFSAGAMLLEIIYGGIYKRESDTNTEFDDRRQNALEKLKKEHPELGALIQKCLSDHPEERPTALELMTNKLLKYEQDFQVTAIKSQQSLDPVTEYRYFPDVPETVQEKLNEIQRKPPDDVLRMMDSLDKELPTENIPQSSTWVGVMKEELLGYPTQSSEHEDPENMSVG